MEPEEVGLQQIIAYIASVQTVVNECYTNWGGPVISKDALNAERLWYEDRIWKNLKEVEMRKIGTLVALIFIVSLLFVIEAFTQESTDFRVKTYG